MVTGCHAQPDNYKECERTWIPKLRELGFKVLISLGSTEVEKNGVLTSNDFANYFKFLDKNTIEFRTFDSKLGLFDKSIKLPSKWVLSETDYEYYFRIDSDSFVHPQKFKKMLEDNLKDFPDLDYMGSCHPNFGYNPHYYFTKMVCRTGFFASGCGYMVSKRGMKIALDKMEIQQRCDFEMDDLVLGRAMWESRVPLLHDSRICFESNYVKLAFDPHNIGIPDISEPNSHLAIQHYINGHMEEVMKKLNL